MEEKPKSRRWVMWLSISLLLIGYPLSYGPYIGIATRYQLPIALHNAMACFHAPLFWMAPRLPQPLAYGWDRYLTWWVNPSWLEN